MFSEEEIRRYNRHFILPGFGEEAQTKLKSSKVLVIGAGGLGAPVLQYLTAAGTGTIGIIDDDRVELSNLQRQILFHTAQTGQLKAETAAENLSALNPNVQFEVYPYRLTTENALDLFSQYDVIVDGSDNFSTRYLVNDACVITKKPLIFGSIFKFEGQVSVFNHDKGPTYRCVFPEAPAPGEMPSCSEIGVLGVLPGMVGSMMVTEAIKLITGVGELLSGRLLIMDALGMQFTTLKVHAVPENHAIFELSNQEYSCDMTVQEISVTELKKLLSENAPVQFIDVREPWEHDEKNIGAENISLYELPQNLERISKDKKVVLHCQSGNRSGMAARLLMDEGFTNVFSLTGGIVAFLEDPA